MKKADQNKTPAFLVVIAFAVAGFALTFFFLNANFKETDNLGKYASVKKVIASDTIRVTTFEINQKFILPPPRTEKDISFNKKGHYLFHYNPTFLIWTMLILLVMTIATGSLPVFINYIREIKKKFWVSKNNFIRIIVFTVVTASILAALPLSVHGYYIPFNIVRDFGILFKNSGIIPGLSISTVLFSLPMIMTMFMVGFAAEGSFGNLSNKSEAKAAIDKFNYLNSVLLAALQVLAIIVVLTGFCSATLGQSIKSVFELTGFDIFPADVSYAYGLFFALFLAIFYIPVYYILKQKGKTLKEQIILSSAGMGDADAKLQAALGENVDLKTSALDSLKLALTILSPLLASFIPEHLNLFK